MFDLFTTNRGEIYDGGKFVGYGNLHNGDGSGDSNYIGKEADIEIGAREMLLRAELGVRRGAFGVESQKQRYQKS